MDQKPLSRDSLSDQIFQSLLDQISCGKLTPGTRLPSEDELAKSYNVSRMTMRSALQKLKVLGVVDSVGGGGSFVKSFDTSQVVRYLSGPIATSFDPAEVKEFRVVLEREILKLVCMRKPSGDDLEALSVYCDLMEHAIDRADHEAFAKYDYLFHLMTCEMTGNRMFSFSYELISSVITRSIQSSMDGGPKTAYSGITASQALRIHRGIVECIRRGDPSEALSLYDKGSSHP